MKTMGEKIKVENVQCVRFHVHSLSGAPLELLSFPHTIFTKVSSFTLVESVFNPDMHSLEHYISSTCFCRTRIHLVQLLLLSVYIHVVSPFLLYMTLVILKLYFSTLGFTHSINLLVSSLFSCFKIWKFGIKERKREDSVWDLMEVQQANTAS